MCSRPITHDGQTFACRSCDDCISTRKSDWVARAMAEKHTMGNAFILAMTYRNNENGDAPDGAKAFKYKDVQRFFYKLRENLKRKMGDSAELTYIVAGERGSDRGRVHWHLALFSNRPIFELGKWTDTAGKPIDGPEMDHRCHWSMWDHGYVFPQTPDQGGMAYVLKYALKDQFNVVKSKGTMRYSKSENHASSMFRMSKKPPIGMRFVIDQLGRWERKNAVPPNLQLKVPEMTGFWWPRGKCREQLLTGIYEINEKIKEETGRNAPQFETLLSTLTKENEVKDLETLLYGPLEQEKGTYDGKEFKEQLARSEAARNRKAATAETRKRCGTVRICEECYRSLSPEERLAVHTRQAEARRKYSESKSPLEFNQWYRLHHRGNPDCLNKNGPEYRSAFGA